MMLIISRLSCQNIHAGAIEAISTRVLETGYSGTEFRPEATSDHALLFSEISLPSTNYAKVIHK